MQIIIEARVNKFSKNLGSTPNFLDASRVIIKSFTLRTHKYLVQPYKFSSPGRPGAQNLCIPFIWFSSSLRCVICANEICRFLYVLISNVFLGEYCFCIESCNTFQLLLYFLNIHFINNHFQVLPSYMLRILANILILSILLLLLLLLLLLTLT